MRKRGGARRDTALVARGLRGQQPGDLQRTVRGFGRALEVEGGRPRGEIISFHKYLKSRVDLPLCMVKNRYLQQQA